MATSLTSGVLTVNGFKVKDAGTKAVSSQGTTPTTVTLPDGGTWVYCLQRTQFGGGLWTASGGTSVSAYGVGTWYYFRIS